MDERQNRLRDITETLATPDIAQETITNLLQERDQLTNDIDTINQRLRNIPAELQNGMKTRRIKLITTLNQERNQLKTKLETLQPEEIIEEISEITIPKTNKTVKSKCFNQFSGGNSPDDDSNEYLTGRKLFVILNIGSQGETHLLCLEIDQLRMLLKDDAQIKIPCIGPRQVYKVDAPESDIIFGRDNDDVISFIIDTSSTHLQSAKNLYDNGQKETALNLIATARSEPGYLSQFGIAGPRSTNNPFGFFPIYKTSIGVEIDVVMLAVQQYFNERPFDKIENLTNNEVDYKNQYVPLSYPNPSDEVTGISRAYLLRDDVLSMIVVAEALQHPESNSETFPVFEVEYQTEITHTVSRKIIRQLRHKNNPDIPTVYLQPEPPFMEHQLDPESELANLYVSANHCQAGSSISVFKVLNDLPKIYNDWLKNNDDAGEELETRVYYDTDPTGAKDFYEYLLHSSIMKPHYNPEGEYGKYWPGYMNLPEEQVIIREREREPEPEPQNNTGNLNNYDQNIQNILPTTRFGNPINLIPRNFGTRPGTTRITNILRNSGILGNRENLDTDWLDFLRDINGTPDSLNLYGYYLERFNTATKANRQEWVEEINNDSVKDKEEQVLTEEQHFLAEKLVTLIGLEYMGWNETDTISDLYEEGISLIIRDSITEKLSEVEFDDEDFDGVLNRNTDDIINRLMRSNLGPQNIEAINSEDTRSTFTIRLNRNNPIVDIIKQTLIMQVLNNLEIPMFREFLNIDLELFNSIIKKLLANPIYILQQSYIEDMTIESDINNWKRILLLYILETSNKGLYSPFMPENSDASYQLYFGRDYGIRLNQKEDNPDQLLRRVPDTSTPDLPTILSYIQYDNDNQTTRYIYANDWTTDEMVTNVIQPNLPTNYVELESSYIIGLIQTKQFNQATKIIKVINAKNLLVYMFGETKANDTQIYSGFNGENNNFQQVFKALSLELVSLKNNIQTNTPGTYRQIIGNASNNSEDLGLLPKDIERLVRDSIDQLEDFYNEPELTENQEINRSRSESSSSSSSDDDDDLPDSFFNVFRNPNQQQPPAT